MKKSLYIFAGVLALAACSKEIQQIENEAPEASKTTYLIRASISPDTKTTVTDAGVYSWADDETIGVADATTSKKAFSVVNAKKDEGVFTYSGDDVDGDLRFAVSPATVLTVPATEGNDAKITLSDSYTYSEGKTNAIMIAGAPTVDENEYVFTFRHAAALLKYTIANVPVGTKTFRVTTDQNISGASVNVDATSVPEIKISDLSGDVKKYVDINLSKAVTEKNTTISFYVPVPTGTYSTFKIELLNVGGTKLVGKTKTIAGGITLGRADLFITPTITLAVAPETETFTLVEDIYDMVNGQYIILAKATDEATKLSYLKSTTTNTSACPKRVEQSIFDGSTKTVSSSAVTDEMLLTFTGASDTWKIQNSDGKILYAPNSNNSYIGSTNDTWVMGYHPSNGSKFSMMASTYSRYLGIYSKNDFRTYTDVLHTNFEEGVTSQIVLYYRGTLAAKPRLESPTEVIVDLNTDDAEVTNTIDVVWADNKNAAANVDSYEITLTPESGTAVTKRTNATEKAEKSISVTGLAYSTEYTVTVRAISADYASFKDSDWTTPDEFSVATTGAKPAGAEDPTTYTVQFGSSYNSGKQSSYSNSWYVTCDGLKWNLDNWNNNNNGWTYVKAGNSKTAYVGTIINDKALDITVKKVTVTIDAITANNVNSVKLYVASDNKFSSGVQTYDIEKTKGEKTITIETPIKNGFYKFAADCKAAANGVIQVSMLTFTNKSE